MDSKVLIAYFSCGGKTKKLAKKLAEVTDAIKLVEIEPEIPYTKADLNWMDKNSRSSVEMNDKSNRPKIRKIDLNTDDFDALFVGFPIWWYVAPTIVNTFLESYDFSGKIIIPFATSGGSGLGNTEEYLKASCSEDAIWYDGRLFDCDTDKKVLADWVNGLNL